MPVILDYDGEKRLANMGPFERSMEREFSLAVNKKAIEDCTSIDQLKQVATNLLVGWSNMQGAMGEMIKENILLRQTLQKGALDLEAAEELLMHASKLLDEKNADPSNTTAQSSQSKRHLWQWWK